MKPPDPTTPPLVPFPPERERHFLAFLIDSRLFACSNSPGSDTTNSVGGARVGPESPSVVRASPAGGKPKPLDRPRPAIRPRHVEAGYAIRTVQGLLGHSAVETTMIDTQVLSQGDQGVWSPLDRP